MSYLEFLDQRKSIRSFDPNVQITNQEIKDILIHGANSPSSNNFQPWKVFVVKNKSKQKILRAFSANQKQVEDASAVFLIFGDKTSYDISKIINFNLKNNIMESNQVEEKAKRIRDYLSLHPEDIGNEGLKFDTGLFSMNLMHVIRSFGYDSVPMRGTDFERIMDFLNIPKNLYPILMLPVGKALNSGYQHLRYDVSDFFTLIE
jgi:Nitroreductase